MYIYSLRAQKPNVAYLGVCYKCYDREKFNVMLITDICADLYKFIISVYNKNN